MAPIRRKRQTRLTFDPINQSSSQSTMSPARVRYELGGVKHTPASSHLEVADVFESDDLLCSSKKDDFSPAPKKNKGKLPFKPLPTPAKSSQPVLDAGSSDTLEEQQDLQPTRSTRQTRSVAKFMPRIAVKKKGYAAFDRSTDSSDESDIEPRITRNNKHSTGFDGVANSSDDSEPASKINPLKKSSTKKQIPTVSLISDTDEAPASITPKTSTKSSRKNATSDTPSRAPRSPTARNYLMNSAKRYTSGMPTRPSQSLASKSKMTKAKPAPVSDSDDDDLVSPSQLGSARKGNTPKLPPLKTYSKKLVSKNDSSDDDPLVSSSKRSQKSVWKLKQAAAIVDEDNEDEEDDILPTPIKRRSRPAFMDEDDDGAPPSRSPLKRPRPSIESAASSDDVSPTKRRRRGTQKPVESNDDVSASPSRSSRGRNRSSASPTPMRTTRQQKGKKKHRTEREKRLELLRRKNNGDTSKLTDSESNSESDDGFESLEVFEDEDEDEELPAPKSTKGEKKSATPSGNADDLDDFIVDDEEDEDNDIYLGMLGVPLEFTSQAHKKSSEHFKDAVEWMVHNKINPAFLRDDDIYQRAFQKLNDECQGLAKSKFASTQWTKEYTKAVYARPILEVHPLRSGEGFDMASGVPKCFACNHRNHKPSVALSFTGKAYSSKTLEDVDQGSDESDEAKSTGSSEFAENSDDGESRSVNSQGQKIPPVAKRYAAGDTCVQNTQYAHQLIHWKYNLNQWVIDALEMQGELTSAKLAEREAMNAKNRTKYANKVVDDWVASRQVKELYGDYKRVLDTARNVKAKHRGGWQ